MQQYHKNFIEAVKIIMASNEISNIKEVSIFINIPYMSLWKIMEGKNKPTIDQCLIICNKGKFTANWIFLNQKPKTATEELSFKQVHKKLDIIIKKINN